MASVTEGIAALREDSDCDGGLAKGACPREARMFAGMTALDCLLIALGLATAVLAVLVIYGNALSTREEDQLYLNNAEQTIMATEQRTLIQKMDRLRNVIVVLAVIAGTLAVASGGMWLYVGLTR